MKKRILFFGKDGKFLSPKENLKKIKRVKVGKRFFKTKERIKKYVFEKRKEKRKKGEVKKKEKIIFRKEIYQTQLGKLDGTHTVKFERDIDWFDVDTENKFVKSFKSFYNYIIRPKKAIDVKFGIIAVDSESNEYISKYSGWLDLIFDDNELREFFIELSDWVEIITLLAVKYMISITNIILTQIIMFKVKGDL